MIAYAAELDTENNTTGIYNCCVYKAPHKARRPAPRYARMPCRGMPAKRCSPLISLLTATAAARATATASAPISPSHQLRPTTAVPFTGHNRHTVYLRLTIDWLCGVPIMRPHYALTRLSVGPYVRPSVILSLVCCSVTPIDYERCFIR